MTYKNIDLRHILSNIDLGSSIAEQDTLLEIARVETSVFSNLYLDRVDLIPGTKGSGKSALYRIFVEFLPDRLLLENKVVIAHGVEHHGDLVFHSFKERFENLDEEDFVNFWCIYFISLVHEQFIKNKRYQQNLINCDSEIKQFLHSCQQARIPEIKARKSLSSILDWTLTALYHISPKFSYKLPDYGGEVSLSLFSGVQTKEKKKKKETESLLDRNVVKIKQDLETILTKSGLNVWLMVDRLDEIFPRRSDLEKRALRSLLRTMRIFTSPQIRIKIFLRDDILNQVVNGNQGFTALTHITARQSDTLRWSEDDILTMIVNRIFANESISEFLNIDKEKIKASLEYRRECFFKIFPQTVHRGQRQSNTLRWIYTHTSDGNSVVTPRDVLDLLLKAIQYQHDILISNPSGNSATIINPQAILHGLSELSLRKRTTYLQAEFPHLWQHIEKFIGGKTEYTETALQKLLAKEWKDIITVLLSIGLLSKGRSKGQVVYKIPFIYRKGLDLTQGKV